MTSCIFCKKPALGLVHMTEDGPLHTECSAPMIRAARGLTHECPQCGQTGKVKDPDSARQVRREVDAPRDERGYYPCAYDGCRGCGACTTGKIMALVTEVPDKPCPLCAGVGWLAKAPKAVTETKIVRWER